MSVLHIAADDLRVGDVIIHEGGETPVRALDRSAAPTIVTNPSGDDEITGQVRREGA